ncbi:MAG: hypothetical protein ABIQ31_22610 [Ferruginibacter sp.]
MKKYSRSLILFIVFVLSFCVLPQIVSAQIGNPDDPYGDPDAPIDGGVSLLVAVGVGYGVKKIRDERKKSLNKTS